jgi:hypothetical protein
MADAPAGGSKTFDPIESMRGLRDIYLDAMAKTMVETVNSEAYAKASGAMLDTTLTMSAPVREGMEKTMVQALQQLSLPTRQDILGLAERLTNLEMRLDDMDAKIDLLVAAAQALVSAANHAPQPAAPAQSVNQPASAPPSAQAKPANPTARKRAK